MEEIDALMTAHPWLGLCLKTLAGALVGYVVHAVVHRIALRAARRYALAERIMHFTRRPFQWLLILLLVHLALADATQPAAVLGLVRQTLSILIILLVTAFVVRLIAALADFVTISHPVTVTDNLRARSLHTKVLVLARTAMFLVGLLGVGSVLMTFPNVRQVGASLLASAGVAGILAGLAARPVLGNLIAGLQIALTQPIRLDDVLIVENEWGRVEEITETYVVIRIWDERRLIVPLEYFIQNPFQNWTRNSSQLLGSVFLWVDFRMPLEPLRARLKEIVEGAPEWDRRVCVLQVTDTSERAMQLRILVSAPSSSTTWDLRCKVREQLLVHLQENYPDMLPQVRATIAPSAHGEDPVAAPPGCRAGPPGDAVTEAS